MGEETLPPVMNTANAATIFVMADRFIKCKRCGLCCSKHRNVFISKDEVRRIAKYLGISSSKFKARYGASHVSRGLWEIPGNPCPFLRGRNQCTIYDLRPNVCRAFPFASQLRAATSKNTTAITVIKRCGKSMALYGLFENLEFVNLVSLKTSFSTEQHNRLRAILRDSND